MKREPWMSQITPVGDNIACTPVDKPKETAGGLVLPEVSPTAGMTVVAAVFAAGPGAMLSSGERKPMEVAIGDTIVFVKAGSYQEAMVDGHTAWCVSEQDVLFVYHEIVAGEQV